MIHNYKLDDENIHLQVAYRAILDTQKNILIVGKAGSGKSEFLKYVLKKTRKKIVVLAPTIAAARLVDGMTIHRFFSLPSKLIIDYEKQKISKGISREIRDVIINLETLIIDEIGMVSSVIMDAIDFVLKKIRGNNLPFGGIQLVMFGDLYQLSPVINKIDKKFVFEKYASGYFFHSNSIREIDSELIKIELLKNYRQKDETYANILDRMRCGNTTEHDLKILNTRVNNDFDFSNDMGTILTVGNDEAEKINKECFDKSPEYPQIFAADILGKNENKIKIEHDLKLKVGCKVIFTKSGLFNGDGYEGIMGTISQIKWYGIHIDLNCWDGFIAKRIRFREYEYYYENESIKRKILYDYLQYPIKLCYAMTIHKAQGSTLDKIHLNLGDGIYGVGQLYVALSRVKSLKDLSLSRGIRMSDIRVDNGVKKFLYDANCAEKIHPLLDEFDAIDEVRNKAMEDYYIIRYGCPSE